MPAEIWSQAQAFQMMRGKPVGKHVSLWNSRLLLLTLQYQRMIAPLCKQKFFPYEHTCLRVFSKSFTTRYHPSVSRHFIFCLLSIMGSHPSLLSLERHQHFNCTRLEPVGASFQSFPSSLVNRWEAASFVPIISQLYLPAVLSYCRAQKRKRQRFYCKLLGTEKNRRDFKRRRLNPVIGKQICGLWNISFYTIFVYR